MSQLLHQPKELTLLTRAEQALAQARTVDEIKSIRDKAEAVRQYAKAADLGLAIQNHAAAVKLKAERKAGELLKQLGLRGGDRRSNHQADGLKLNDLGISQNESTRWQREAAVPEREFKRFIEKTTRTNRELTSSGPIKLATQLEAAKTVSAPPEKGQRVVDNLSTLLDDGATFACIYADPPWAYDNQGTRAATSNLYPTLSADKIANLPVAKLAAARAHLHLWTTNAFLADAQAIIAAWGFEYKGVFVWVKPQIGIGNYWRVSHEFMLLGVRGNLPFVDRSLPSLLEADRTGHSEKPAAVRALIERASPAPRLEMFARQAVPGWIVFGNQVASCTTK
jgi:N6-adenosine-specific RNA methylase IME4